MESSAPSVVVLDVDGAIIEQQRLLAKYHPTVIPLRDRSAELRYWCRLDRIEEIKCSVARAVGPASPKVILYGSGDFHHLAYVGISLVDQPVTVIHFDAHTDFLKSPPGYIHAGSWVVSSSELPHVRKVIQLGIEGDIGLRKDMPLPFGPLLQRFNLLLSGKLELYPKVTRRSFLLGRMDSALPSVELKARGWLTEARWKNFQDHGGIEATVERITKNIPTEAVYLTIDKDVLIESVSFTNYQNEQGSMNLTELLTAVSLIRKRKTIIGADICGDGSYFAAKKNRLKRLVFRLKDRGIPACAFSSNANTELNEDANLRILEQLLGGEVK